ncbi:MAG: hypothetical protein R3D98_04255 [Candidatus Krumholzibacteriia bacterium]
MDGAALAGPPDLASAAVAVATAGLGLLLWRGRPGAGSATTAALPGSPRSGRRWLAGHAIVLAVALAVGLPLGGFANPPAVALSLLLYPLYAALQLLLLLRVPWPWLEAASAPRRGPAVAAAALLFGLVHWPNPAVMAMTTAGMALWAAEHARGRSLAALAASMGLLATLAAQGLPDPVTHHMRVGPQLVQARALPDLTARTLATLPPTAAPIGPFLDALYPSVVGRPATRQELRRWTTVAAHEQRCFLAWQILTSREYGRRHQGLAPPAMDGSHYWTALAAPWPGLIRGQAAAVAADAPWAAYVESCYVRLLGRRPDPAEVAAWPAALGPLQYQGLLQALLDRRRDLAAAPFDTLASEALRFWR